VFSVEKRMLKGAEMAIVTVMPSDMPPVKYDGRIWIRTGPRRSIANEQEERVLNEKRRYKNLPFDIYPVPSAKSLIYRNRFLKTNFSPQHLPPMCWNSTAAPMRSDWRPAK